MQKNTSLRVNKGHREGGKMCKRTKVYVLIRVTGRAVKCAKELKDLEFKDLGSFHSVLNIRPNLMKFGQMQKNKRV